MGLEDKIKESIILAMKAKDKTRLEALRQAEKENYEVAILDDGLQDKSINHNLSFICFNNISWIGNGLTIPAGPLREKLIVLKVLFKTINKSIYNSHIR